MQDLINLMKKIGAYQTGQFQLTSGQVSDYYIDGKKIALHSQGLHDIGAVMFYKICQFMEADNLAIGGPELGAVSIVGAVLAQFGFHLAGTGVEVEGFVIRKEVKGHGLKKRIEGSLSGSRNIAIIEDVITTGSSAMQAVELLRQENHHPKMVLCIVDREQGARELFEKNDLLYCPLLLANQFHK